MLDRADTNMVRTKTGNKIHLAPKGSSITYCGIRYGGVVRKAPPGCKGCGSCGLGSSTVDEMNARFGQA